ncbi:MAG: MalY/PatB family protein [Paracoccaceae bacterium]|jgi:cystathionine beta-lyase
MTFETKIDRRGTHSTKWDRMEAATGTTAPDALAMWTADSDYPTAPCVIEAMLRAVNLGVFGYSWAYPEYLNAIQWWMKTRHKWEIETDWILTSQGLGHAIAMCLDVWSEPGDGVVTFNPVYHEFAHKSKKAGRGLVECPLKLTGDHYDLDLDDAQSRLTGREKVLLWCSPQNPSGRIWSVEELRAVAEFAERNDLLLVSDEIHHDLIYSGETFIPMDVAAPDYRHRLVVLTAASKTFNIAGQRTGNMIIPDPKLRATMANRLNELDYGPSALGVQMIEAAYSPAGAAWVDAQMEHLARNKATFDAAINAIPGVRSLPLRSTYLAWVDFSGTGMSAEESARRIREDARIAVSPGPGFGLGGETFQRFNLATSHARVEEACRRMTEAFSDLQ